MFHISNIIKFVYRIYREINISARSINRETIKKKKKKKKLLGKSKNIEERKKIEPNNSPSIFLRSTKTQMSLKNLS